MKPHPIVERAIYVAVDVLALLALGLSFVAPSSFTETGVVYQGF